ncbi:MAG TPA: NAD(P)-binding domain-containing protein [Gaiellaceae bacterium]|nr:NAD(P)-binding domain-containing protein [Gaiellaceae bacterium]
MAGVEGVHPPGEYPVVVVGSGPGGLQTAYALSRLGVVHAVISQDDSPGGMFRKWPIFQRLLSWTKPDAPFDRSSREYEWYDHNSLLADEPELRATVAAQMNRQYMVPSCAEMEQGLVAFAERGGVQVRFGCRWESTRQEDDGYVLVTSDGEYRCRAVVFALGVTDPWKSPIPGIEDVPHYADTPREAREFQGKSVLIIGKRNSGFELADGLEPWARQIFLVSPRPVQTAVLSMATVRVRYFEPLEDASWGGGTFALDAAVERIERTENGGFRLQAAGTTRPGPIALEADAAIAATGFRTPIQDLRELGLSTVADGRIPALTPYWESTTLRGVFFAGNTMQGAAGLRKNGVGSASGTVSGFRYNARLLAQEIAKRLGHKQEWQVLGREEIVPFLLSELRAGPEIWTQKGYLARAVYPDGSTGIVPLAHFLDHCEQGSIAVTIEMNAQGDIYPVMYKRGGEEIVERDLQPHHLNDFGGTEYRAALESLL